MQEFVEVLAHDFPSLRFKPGKKFAFRPPRTVFFEQPTERESSDASVLDSYRLRLLHELGHAQLGHTDFVTDVERLKLERAAWEKAREFCAIYNVNYDEDLIEVELDSYRDWLHNRSRCPECGLTRYQTVDGASHCPGCML